MEDVIIDIDYLQAVEDFLNSESVQKIFIRWSKELNSTQMACAEINWDESGKFVGCYCLCKDEINKHEGKYKQDFVDLFINKMERIFKRFVQHQLIRIE